MVSTHLAHEKLTTVHGFDLSVETLRSWMIAADLWIPRSKRLKRPYQPRYNRDCFGELDQIDGSYHDWYEGRAAKCCLLVYIDDATGKLQHLRFCEAESAFDYMISTRLYVEQQGKPLAIYSDKQSVFRVNQSSKKDTKITQFGRVLSTLNIDIIRQFTTGQRPCGTCQQNPSGPSDQGDASGRYQLD